MNLNYNPCKIKFSSSSSSSSSSFSSSSSSFFVFFLSQSAYRGVCHICQCLWQDDFRHNREQGGKQAQDPPGSLHTVVSSVELSSLKGRGPR